MHAEFHHPRDLSFHYGQIGRRPRLTFAAEARRQVLPDEPLPLRPTEGVVVHHAAVVEEKHESLAHVTPVLQPRGSAELHAGASERSRTNRVGWACANR